MSYTAVVPSIYNNALAGCLAGLLGGGGRALIDPTAADYAGAANAASAYAQELDTLIGGDATLATAGATVVPATAANQNAALTKPALINALSQQAWAGRSASSVTPTDYTAVATAVKAAYTEALTLTSAL